MTFAIVRRGVIVDFARHDTLFELADWMPELRKGTKVVMLNLAPGESASVGARVVVTELRVGMAALAESRTPVGVGVG